jgi:hypothetical protein
VITLNVAWSFVPFLRSCIQTFSACHVPCAMHHGALLYIKDFQTYSSYLQPLTKKDRIDSKKVAL